MDTLNCCLHQLLFIEQCSNANAFCLTLLLCACFPLLLPPPAGSLS